MSKWRDGEGLPSASKMMRGAADNFDWCLRGMALLARASGEDETTLLGWFAAGLVAVATGIYLYLRRRNRRRRAAAIRGALKRMAGGDFGVRVAGEFMGSAGSVAAAVNEAAEAVERRFDAALRKRVEDQAVLASMVEGVIAVDAEERVLSVNPAAAALLGVDINWAVGRSIQEAVRNSALQRLVSEAIRARGTVEGDVSVLPQPSDGEAEAGEQERHLQVRGAPLNDEEGRRLGAVIVIEDVTRLRRLERVRRDFVANASHEIRTPLASIQGAAETLLESAGMEESDQRRFLKIIGRQAERLHALVEDLLNLARVEQAGEERTLERKRVRVREVLADAVEACRHAATSAEVRLELDCPEELEADLHASTFEQAVVNLIDNAIKYGSGAGNTVWVAAEGRNGADEVAVTVRDQGVGIDPEHQARIFERFYRVDKGRSRQQGGTGLGLAIVRHIAAAHGGEVAVESRQGQGTTFTIRVPRTAA